jgi:hypothetical protein
MSNLNKASVKCDPAEKVQKLGPSERNGLPLSPFLRESSRPFRAGLMDVFTAGRVTVNHLSKQQADSARKKNQMNATSPPQEL